MIFPFPKNLIFCPGVRFFPRITLAGMKGKLNLMNNDFRQCLGDLKNALNSLARSLIILSSAIIFFSHTLISFFNGLDEFFIIPDIISLIVSV